MCTWSLKYSQPPPPIVYALNTAYKKKQYNDETETEPLHIKKQTTISDSDYGINSDNDNGDTFLEVSNEDDP